jgi:hypothetical protein
MWGTSGTLDGWCPNKLTGRYSNCARVVNHRSVGIVDASSKCSLMEFYAMCNCLYVRSQKCAILSDLGSNNFKLSNS